MNSQVTVRVDKNIIDQFKIIAEEMDKKTPQLIRELILAMVDDRIKITPKNHRSYDMK